MDMKKKIEEIAKKNAVKLRFRTPDELKDKQIANALKGFAAGCRREDIVVMADTTLLNSGKEGYLFSVDGMYSSDSSWWDKRPYIPYTDIQSVNKAKKNDSMHFHFADGKEENIYASIYRDEVVSILKNIVRAMAGEETAKAADTSETEETAEEDAVPETDEAAGNEAADEEPEYDVIQTMNDDSQVGIKVLLQLEKDGKQYLLGRGEYQDEPLIIFYEKTEDGLRVIRDDDEINLMAALFTEEDPSLRSLLYDDNEDEAENNVSEGSADAEPEVIEAENSEAESENIVILKDEDGKDVRLEILDVFNYEEKNYVVLAEEDTDDGSAIIMEIIESEDGGEESFANIESEEMLQKLYNIFKARCDDKYNFAEPDRKTEAETETETERPIPYDGDEPYIFISYSHKDSDMVFPIIRQLQRDNFRVWYDDGIDPGSEWDDFIADHVQRSGCFIAFMSKNYLNSTNCRDEVSFARDKDVNRLLIYLDDVELTGGMAMRLNRLQALFYYKYPQKPLFYQRLYASSVLTDSGVRKQS